MGSLLLCNAYICTYERAMSQKKMMHYVTNANELCVVVTANEAVSPLQTQIRRHVTKENEALCYKRK